jgi:feruloyl esterase
MTGLARRFTATALLILALLGMVVATAAQAAPVAKAAVDARIVEARSCERFAAEDFRNLAVPAMLISSKRIPAAGKLPEYCQVTGVIQPQIQFEMRLPTKSWNGRYYQVGCGGFCGVIGIDGCDPALAADFVVAAQNMGHVGLPIKDPVWGSDVALRADFGGRSTHLMAVTAKAIAERYYGKRPAYSYFQGCSTGGREGLMEAQHAPGDFDGIIAGDPAFAGRLGALANNWDARHLLRTDGSDVFTPAKLKVLNDAVLKRCDKIDGLADGILMDPRRCTFDAATIACPADDRPDCLTAEQVATAKALYQGPVNAAGVKLMPGATPFGSELSWSGAGRLALAGGYLRYLAHTTNPASDYDWRSFDFDKDVEGVESQAALYDPVAPHTAPDLTAFAKAGGKLLVYHGFADAGVSPFALLDYRAQVAARQGGSAGLAPWFRVFMVPGMFHCRGGNAPNEFDTLQPMIDWVEKGVAPERLIAVQRQDGKVLRSRPLYPYPAYASFTGKGDVADAANWKAATPKGPVDDRIAWIWSPRD